MQYAYPSQKLQDWITQQWVIIRGKKIIPTAYPWLMGPFGKIGAISDDFILRLAEREGLSIQRKVTDIGLLSSIKALNLSDAEMSNLSKEVINFYEKTGRYQFEFSVKWNPFFQFCGKLLAYFFSNRIKQLNIPTTNIQNSTDVTSEIITLIDPMTHEVKYIIWYRTFEKTGQVLYSGIYTTCTLPSGQVCIKAIFPLPNGNATVIMSPEVGKDGSLQLNSCGKKFGEPGFYFLLNDTIGNFWTQFISSFKDQLNVRSENGKIIAIQTLTLWGMQVLQFKYNIFEKDLIK